MPSPLQPLNPLLDATEGAPIPAAGPWLAAYDGAAGPAINLSQAVPGRAPEPELLAALAQAAGAAEAARYGAILGDEVLRVALAADISRTYRGEVCADDIVITSGCNQAFFVTLMTLAKAGDEVILPTPWYFNYKMTLDMLGMVAVPLPCAASNGFVPDVGHARALITPRTRALVLITPNNPTGAVYDRATIAAFAALAKEAGIRLVLDETYRDFLPDGHDEAAHDLFARGDWREVLVHLYSFSKSYAVPGHRIGALAGGAAFLEQLTKVMDSLQICAPRTGQLALADAVEPLLPARRRMRAEFNVRAQLFTREIAQAEGWELSSIGAYFAYLRHPFAQDGAAVAEALAREAGILTLPGAFFGPGQEDFLRVAFANVEDDRLAGLGARLNAFGAGRERR